MPRPNNLRRARLMTVSKAPGVFQALAGWVAVPILAFIAYCVVLSMYQDGQPEAGLISVLMLAFLYGVVFSLLSIIGVAVESVRARRLVHLLEHKGLAESLQAKEGSRGLFLAVVRGLYRQYLYAPHAINADVLMEAMNDRLGDRVGKVLLLGQLLVCVGAIGTVVGLILMVDGMSSAVTEASGGADLMVALFRPGGAMSGLGTAFMTTLVGSVLGGVVLRCMAVAQQRAIDRLVNHYWEQTMTYILPDLIRHAAGAAETVTDRYPLRGGRHATQTI